MDIFFKLINHLFPVLITLLIIALVYIVKIGAPYLKHIALVAKAHDDKGVKALAQHLAQKAGGKKINVDDAWKAFIPAAETLGERHQEKKQSL